MPNNTKQVESKADEAARYLRRAIATDDIDELRAFTKLAAATILYDFTRDYLSFFRHVHRSYEAISLAATRHELRCALDAVIDPLKKEKPTMKLQPFTTESPCPKCGFQHSKIMYQPAIKGTYDGYVITGLRPDYPQQEHILRECQRCGYEWRQACIDMKGVLTE